MRTALSSEQVTPRKLGHPWGLPLSAPMQHPRGDDHRIVRGSPIRGMENSWRCLNGDDALTTSRQREGPAQVHIWRWHEM